MSDVMADNHPVAHKASVVRTFMSRANVLSSNGVEGLAAEKRSMETLKEIGYPLRFIHRRQLLHWTNPQVWYTRSLAQNATCTLDSLAENSSTASVNIGGHSKTVRLMHSLAQHAWSIGHRVDLSKTEVTEPGLGNTA